MSPNNAPVTTDTISDLLHEAQDDRTSSLVKVSRRFEAIENEQLILKTAVENNTKLTAGIAGDTAELLDLFRSVKGGFKVLSWLGNFAKWVAAILAAFAAIYAFVHNIKGVP